MLTKKLTRTGTSQSLILSKDLLAQLGLEEGAEVMLVVAGRTLIVQRPDLSARERLLSLALAETMTEDDELLERLA